MDKHLQHCGSGIRAHPLYGSRRIAGPFAIEDEARAAVDALPIQGFDGAKLVHYQHFMYRLRAGV
jgi:hypothetical protein